MLLLLLLLLLAQQKMQKEKKCKFLKIRIRKQISSWRKELSLIDEAGTGSDNGKLNRKNIKKYRMTIAREVAQSTETLKQKVQAKAQKSEGIKKGKPSTVRIRCLTI
jgi:hypothetical protein